MDIFGSVTNIPGVGVSMKETLSKLQINNIYELFLHLPSRYIDFRSEKSIRELRANENATLKVSVVDAQNVYTKNGKNIQLFTLSDGVSEIKAIWFSQPYIIKSIPVGEEIKISGSASFWKKKLAFFSPHWEKINQGFYTETGRLVAVYSETKGVSSKRLRKILLNALNLFENNKIKIDYFNLDLIPQNLNIDFLNSLKKIHFPKDLEDAESGRQRLAYDELLELSISREKRKNDWIKNTKSYKLKIDKEKLSEFIDNLGYELTPSQKRSVDEILTDLTNEIPMNRLLLGDVGSGKTIVSATAILISFLSGYQSIVLAPTQILAQQHFETYSKLFDKYGMKVGLVTSKSKIDENEKIDLYVGTHALLSENTIFEKCAFIVVDEQHRFGVAQRAKIMDKATKSKMTPNILTMTATPIPRTVALTLYGDLSISTLDELPKNRVPISTWIVPPIKRTAAYRWIDDQIKTNKTQVFIVCPLIEDSESETMTDVRSVKQEFEKLKKIFKDYKLGLLHGKMSNDDKSQAIYDFKTGKTNILVSTSVVEVGIDIPNATIIAIESAERFGFAQLHQLRGRVGRGSKKSYCMLFSDSKSETAFERLEIIKNEVDGRKLAERDLLRRGPGEIFGTKQSGYNELKIARWDDIDLIKQSREQAKEILKNPQNYEDFFKFLKNKQLASN